MKKFKLNLRSIGLKIQKTIEKKPLLSLIFLLGTLVGLIVIGNVIRQPKIQTQATPSVKQVSVYKVGSVPKISFQAQIEKTGVVQITAQTGGVVSKINVKEGSKVYRGTSLISLSNTYTGGNALSLSRQMAQKQYDYIEAIYSTQKDLIGKQRDIANQTETGFEKIREITDQSKSDTQNLINLNNDIISTLDTNIQNLSVDPVGNATIILTSKQLESQFRSANIQLNSSLRNANYQTDTNNPPTNLANIQRDLALSQLDLQEKSLDLNKDISALQLKLAQVNESLMYPSSPFSGTVERVLVRVGQVVNPGTPLVILSGSKNTTVNAIVYLSKDLANSISKIEPAVFYIGNKTVTALPAYISNEATSGNLYTAIYHLPQNEYSELGDKEYIIADLPIGYPDTDSVIPFLPLDSVYQTQDDAYVFVVENGLAKTKQIKLGNVMGNYVSVNSGLTAGDQVITDRTVIDGQKIEIK